MLERGARVHGHRSMSLVPSTDKTQGTGDIGAERRSQEWQQAQVPQELAQCLVLVRRFQKIGSSLVFVPLADPMVYSVQLRGSV